MASLQLQQELVGPCAEDLLLTIKPSASWSLEDVDQVSSIVQSRNRFVCMQLVTMVKEQFSKVLGAAAGADAEALHAAQFMFLATLTSPESSSVVAAGLFYPRACSKDGQEMPHVYVELICCNSPGKGLGSLLLTHIEQFVADNCDAISEGFFGVLDSQGTVLAHDACLAPSDSGSVRTAVSSEGCVAASSAATACGSTAQQDAAPQRRSYSSLPVFLADDPSTAAPAMQDTLLRKPPAVVNCQGLSCSASNSSISSLASNVSSSTFTSTGSSITSVLGAGSSGSCTSLASMQLSLPDVFNLSCGCGNAVAGVASGLHSSEASSAGSVVTSSKIRVCKACKMIQGVKLLSVQSAQGFYTKCGYGAPDNCSEMFKPLPALQHSMAPALPHQAAF
jgi:hypothetical protein